MLLSFPRRLLRLLSTSSRCVQVRCGLTAPSVPQWLRQRSPTSATLAQHASLSRLPLLQCRHLSASRRANQAESEAAVNVPPTVTLFTKDTCHLCTVIKNTIKQSRIEFDLVQVNLALPKRHQWLEKYGHDIPVIHINGVYAIKHRTSLVEA